MRIKKKVSKHLVQQITSDASEVDMLDVIIELETRSEKNLKQNSSKSKSEQIAERKESFARITAPVEDVITQVGGTILEKAWINRTLRAKLPVSGLEAVSELEEVEILDSPHEIEPESQD